MKRVFNFSSGPATMPLSVLERARDELVSLDDSGKSVIEMSHRSREFGEILARSEQGIRDLMKLSDDYHVLFLQGGATLQFSMVPMNFMPEGGSADFVVTGSWSSKAAREAQRFGDANVIYSSEPGGFRTTPEPGEVRFGHGAGYVHYTSNETIDGVEFKYDLDAGGIPVICDASSNILSKPFDIEKFALIYAGAQKNIGPSGVTVVIVRKDLLRAARPRFAGSLLDYGYVAENHSLPNTPNTWGIYMIGLVCDWLKEQGGVAGIEQLNIQKAAMLYECIDSSDGFYAGHAERRSRSAMNVTFRLPSATLDDEFCNEAARHGLEGLRGHRTVGGIRASIYNAFPIEGVEALVDFMKDFAGRNG